MKKTIETDTVTAPAYWASALVNGDESSFDYSDDQADYDAYKDFCEYLAQSGWRVVDVVRDKDGNGRDPRFTWNGTLHHSAYSGCEVIDYVIMRNPSD